MSTFGDIIFTDLGRNLQAKAQAGAQLTFTRIAIGDGDLAGTLIANLTGLKHEVKSLTITKLKHMAGGVAIVGTSFTNQDVVTGFYWKELGVFAQDPDLGEILYCYGNAGENAEYIPSSGGTDILEKSVDVVTIVGNAASVTATINNSLIYVSVQDFEDHTGDNVIHVSQADRDEWDTKETPDGAQAKADAVQDNLSDHLAVTAIHLATGTANAIVITTGGDFTYTQFRKVAFKAIANNTGNVTINVDAKGVVPLKRDAATQVPAAGLKQNKVYEAYYDVTGVSFFLLARASGNAVAGDVLAGKTFSNDEGEQVGSLIFPHGSQTFSTPGIFSFTVPADVKSITAIVTGGGGGGGGSHGYDNSGGAGGGGAGGTFIDIITVTPGAEISGIVGLGGAGGGQDTSGSAGGNTSFAGHIAYGGGGGIGVEGGAGGAGGAGGGMAGGAGNDGDTGWSDYSSSGSYIGSMYGVPGGVVAGAGGNGGAGAGQAGADGKVILLW